MPEPADLKSLANPQFEDLPASYFMADAGAELATIERIVNAAMVDLKRQYSHCMLRPAAHSPVALPVPLVRGDKELLAFAVKFKVMNALAKGLFASAKVPGADPLGQGPVVQSVQRDLSVLQVDIARISGKMPANGPTQSATGAPPRSGVRPSMQNTLIGASTPFKRG